MRDTVIVRSIALLSLLAATQTMPAPANPTCLTEEQIRQRLTFLLHDSGPTLWRCSDDALTLIPEQKPEARSVGDIVRALNLRLQSRKLPQVRIVRTDRDTVVVTVDDPAQLTQKMGTTGAHCYLAEVTFSVTSMEEVDYIWLDVPEGDHAGPGRLGRASFPDLLPFAGPGEK